MDLHVKHAKIQQIIALPVKKILKKETLMIKVKHLNVYYLVVPQKVHHVDNAVKLTVVMQIRKLALNAKLIIIKMLNLLANFVLKTLLIAIMIFKKKMFCLALITVCSVIKQMSALLVW